MSSRSILGIAVLVAGLLAGCGGSGGGGGVHGRRTPAPSPAPPQAPAAPTGLAATPGDAEVTLDWRLAARATSYEVFRATVPGGPYALAGSPAAPPFTDRGLANGTTYFYVVEAANAAGTSAPSSEAGATPTAPAPQPPPAAPTGVTATAGNAQVTLDWTPVAGATSYNVLQSYFPGAYYYLVATPSAPPFVHAGLWNGTPHYYVVEAVGPAGTSARSSEASATPTLPPLTTWAIAYNAHVRIGFTPWPGAAEYALDRATVPGGPYSQIATGVPQYLIFDDATVANGTTYYYVVRALDAAGATLGASAESSATPDAPPVLAPPAVTAVASPLGTAVGITWTAVPGATSYRIVAATTSGGPYATLDSQVTGLSFRHDLVAPADGATFYYAVEAIHTSNYGRSQSGLSAEASATVLPPVPPAPAVAATAGDALVTLAWQARLGDEFHVSRGTSPGGPYASIGTALFGTLEDDGLVNGATYYYVVEGRNVAGMGPVSAEVAATPQGPRTFFRPGSPTGKVAVLDRATTAVASYDATQDGDGRPARAFGNATRLDDLYSLALDRAHGEILVAAEDAILVFDRGATGNAAPVRTIEGPGTGISHPRAIALDPDRDELYVLDAWRVLVFARSAAGNAAPLRTFFDPFIGESWPVSALAVDPVHDEVWLGYIPAYDIATLLSLGFPFIAGLRAYPRGTSGPTPHARELGIGLGRGISAIAADAVHDEVTASLYGFSDTIPPSGPPPVVVTWGRGGAGRSLSRYAARVSIDPVNDEVFLSTNAGIQVFARTATGTASPLRTLSSSSPGVFDRWYGGATAVDPAADELLVASAFGSSITTYDLSASGTAQPRRAIAPGLAQPFALAADEPRGELFLATAIGPFFGISAYPLDARGAASPLRTISGFSTGLFPLAAVAADPVHHELFGGTFDSIVVHPADEQGDVAPVRTISGLTTVAGYGTITAGGSARGLAVDTVHDELYVVTDYRSSMGFAPRVTVFDRAAAGPAPAPRRQIDLGLAYPVAIAVDAAHDEIFVLITESYYFTARILVFARTATGAAAPLRVIEGPLTLLERPTAIAVDPANDEVFVATLPYALAVDPAVVVFPRTASGNVAPARRIAGRATGLADPAGLAIIER